MQTSLFAIANVIGLLGLSGVICFSILLLISFLSNKKTLFLIFALFFSFSLFALGTLMVPGENKILEKVPSKEAILQRARENESQGFLQKAEKDYQKLLELAPLDSDAQEGLGRIKREEFARNLFREGRKCIRKEVYGKALSNFLLAQSLTSNSELKKEIKGKVLMIHNMLEKK